MVTKLQNLARLAVIAGILLTGMSAEAQEETPWTEGDFSNSRLVASHKSVPSDPAGPLYFGWQVKLQEGWKTYWRTPGSAGLPPVFSWQGSINVARAEVLYPFPERFEIFDLQTYGYHNEVVYPILVTPAVPGAPVTLKARVNYLVCEDLCVPMVDEFELTLPASGAEAPMSVNAGLIGRFLRKVPEQEVKTGKHARIRKATLAGVPGRENLILRLEGNQLLSGADVIVEDANGFRFGVPNKTILAAGNEAEFIIPVTAESPGASLAGTTLTVLVADGWGKWEEIRLPIIN